MHVVLYWGHGAGAKGHGEDTFFIALKHGVDTFFAVSSHGSDTFFHYLEANEKIFTEKMQLQLYFSLKQQTVIEVQLHL